MRVMILPASAMWPTITVAEKIGCCLDGDVVQVVAYRNADEVLIAELGIGAWKNKGFLTETLAQRGAQSKEQFQARVKILQTKEVFWFPE